MLLLVTLTNKIVDIFNTVNAEVTDEERLLKYIDSIFGKKRSSHIFFLIRVDYKLNKVWTVFVKQDSEMYYS